MQGQVEILAGLNEPQLEAVTHREGPLLVLAGAGSGKTRVLTCRVAYLLAEGLAQPEEILAVTFTNKAAGEMKARIGKLSGVDPRRMQVSTFHSFAARLLRIYGERIGIPTGFTIYDEEDALALAKNCLKELGIDSKTVTPRLARYRISDAKSELVGLEEYERLAADFITEKVARVYSLYQRRLRQASALDFDDLLCEAVRLMASDEATRTTLQNRYRYLLIDEYQDTNRAQYQMALQLAGSRRNLFAVGDEDQSIYGWRGANIDNILDFEDDFPNCRIVRLEQNYRSTQTILKAASTVIANNKLRKGKTLFSKGEVGEPVILLITESDRAEAEEVTGRIEQQISSGVSRGEIAILYRTNAQSRVLEESLKRHFVAYRIVGGVRFYQRKEVKDLLAYLRLMLNPKDDISFGRVINYPRRGIGATTLTKLSTAATARGCSLLELTGNPALPEIVPRAAALKLLQFAAMLTELNAKLVELPLEPFIGLVAEKVGIVADLRAGDPVEAEARLDNISELASAAGEYQENNPEAGLREYLEEISLYTDLDELNRNGDAVTLMTLHAAKGLEFDSVFITGLEEGLFPLARCLEDPRQLEEERRLMYVGMTRARRQLAISYAQSRARFGETLAMRSRFVDELPDEQVEAVRLTLLNRQGQINTDYRHPAPQASNDTYGAIRVGSIVYHPRWGEGQILSKVGAGESTEFEVRFTYAGCKRLLARYAKLRLVR
jgi:DNA helicase-2/ATP-dependent DNA helicase PcrA